MRNIVLKVPTAIFILLVLLPLIILLLQMFANTELLEPKYYGIVSVIGSLAASIWLFSIVDYFQSKAPDFKFTHLIYALLALDVVFDLLGLFSNFEYDQYLYLAIVLLQALIFISATVFIILLVHKVFYERAVWFIVLEFLIVIIGITTLTPEIKRNEKELLAKDLD